MTVSLEKHFCSMLFGICLMAGMYQIVFAQPQLVVQTGHKKMSAINSSSFSPDGKLLASASTDNTVKIWDIATGIELRSINVGGIRVQKIAFNPNGTGIIIHTIRRMAFWNVTTGKPVWTNSKVDNSANISSDGSFFVSDSRTGLTIWDGNTGKKLRDIEISYNIGTVIFSPDNQTLAINNSKGLLRIISAKDGKTIVDFPNQEKRVNHLIFSPDGKKLVTTKGGKISVWDIKTGKLIKSFENSFQIETNKTRIFNVQQISFSTDNKTLVISTSGTKFALWNAESGKKIKTFKDYAEKGFVISTIGSINFSTDNKYVVIGSGGNLSLWDSKNWELIKIFEEKSLGIEHVLFNPKGNKIATISEFGLSYTQSANFLSHGRKINLWADDGQDFRLLRENTKHPTIVFKDDGNSIFSFVNIKTSDWKFSIGIKEWNIDSNNEMQKSPLQFEWIDRRRFLFSPDASLVAAVGEFPAKISFYDVKTGRLINTIDTDKRTLGFIKFSYDGKLFATATTNRTTRKISLKVWEVRSGKLLQTFTAEDSIKNIAFSFDGKLVTAYTNKLLKIWQMSDGKEVQKIEKPSCSTRSIFFNHQLTFSSNNKYVACASDSLEKYPNLKESNEKDLGETVFKISLFNVSTGKLLREFEGHQQKISAIDFSNDDKYLVSGSDDAQTKIWDISSGKELASLIVLNEKDWLVTTPEGFFDGSPNAWKQLFWRFNNDTFDTGAIELYFNDFFYPNLLKNILNGNTPKAPLGSKLEKKDRRQPIVDITQINKNKDNSNPVNQRVVNITIEATDNNEKKKQPSHKPTGGAKDLRLFRNGSLVKVWRGDAFKLGKNDGCEQIKLKRNQPKRVRCTVQVPIVAGENRFTAYGFNDDNVKSNDSDFTIQGTDSLKREGILYVLAIGIDKYKNSSYDLNFAVKDVVDISKSLTIQQQKLRQTSNIKQYAKTEVITLTDELATKTNILKALEKFAIGDKASLPNNASEALKTELSKIKQTQPEDALLIYYAGHGVSNGKRFYLLPHNFEGDSKKVEEQSVSDIELNDYLEKVDVGKMLMAIDACQSGQALGGKNEGKAPMNSKGLAQLAYDKGMLVLTAAQSYQAALEAVNLNGKEIKHGLLTYALLEALNKPEADKDGNKQLWEKEWFDYATNQVPQMQLEAMKQRNIEIKNGKRGVEIFYNPKDKKKDPNKRKVQTPRIFYKREVDMNPLVVAKS